MTGRASPGPRAVALVGPYLSGKTSLLESILFVTGAITRKGSARDKNMVGDSAPEARERGMGIELNVASTTYLGDRLTFLDCPGSIEFLTEACNAVIGADAAVLVWEPDRDRALTVAPIMKFLSDHRIPTAVFVNKIDRGEADIGAAVAALQTFSSRPLVLRHAPLRNGEAITGYVDLPSERAFVYRPSGASERAALPEAARPDAGQARFAMLEKLADFNDHLMEQLLEDAAPPPDEVYGELTKEFQDSKIVPVLFGAGEREYGVRRLLKLIRHEVPPPLFTAQRLGLAPEGEPVGQVLKIYNTMHGGKLTLARVWRGWFTDGMTLNGERVSGLMRLRGLQAEKVESAEPGDVIALGRMEAVRAGDTVAQGKGGAALPRAERLPPVYSAAIQAKRREDEVKLSTALAKLVEEDPSIVYEQSQDTHQLLLHGQGEIHLRVAADRLKTKYGIEVAMERPRVPYKEAIRRGVTQHGRHKRQSGGHGQFGDVHIEIKPLPRGSGFVFNDNISGGVVPRQYIPAVEAGVSEYLVKGPLGFPVVDVSVTLFDGQYHTVDSSEMAFKTAARIAMSEGMPKCEPVLLEPILSVAIAVPTEFTSRVNTLVSGRRGQILGFHPRPAWEGWDVVDAQIPQVEVYNLIIELRSLTLGVGTYTAKFDRLQELQGRLADEAVATSQAAE